MYDLIVIGAGPAGIMASITAAKEGNKVLLLDKNDYIGVKLSRTGGGRCNITNLKDTREFINSLPTESSKFLYSSFSNFNSYDLYYYIQGLGVELKEEDSNRIFPVSNKSIDIIRVLHKELVDNNVELMLGSIVKCVTDYRAEGFEVELTTGELYTNNVMIATGGLSYPDTGCDGLGYIIASDYNHTIIDNYPCESPLISQDKVIQDKTLQGITLKNVEVKSYSNYKVLKKFKGDLIITHFGLSGPCAFKHSQFLYHGLKNNEKCKVSIDLCVNYDNDELINELKLLRSESNKEAKTILKKYTQTRVIDYILDVLSLTDKKISDLSNENIDEIVKKLKTLPFNIHDVKPVQNAFVTGGGVSLDEVNPKTMESKKRKGLYFAGEVLDVHGFTGGYNITIAMSTGYTAGISINKE